MYSESDSKERLRNFCLLITKRHIPHEYDFFDEVWNAFWSVVGHERVEELGTFEFTPLSDGPILNLGAIGEQQNQILDTLYVVGTCCLAAAALMKDSRDGEISLSDVRIAIQNKAHGMKAPQHISKILERDAVGMLADLLGATDRDANGIDTVCTSEISKEDRVSLLVSQLKNGKLSRRKVLTEETVSKYKREQKFKLWVDENENSIEQLENGMYVKKGVVNNYKKRDFALLYVILNNVGDTLSYKAICEAMRLKGIKYKSVPQYKSYLLEGLGAELVDRMVEPAGTEEYLFPKEKWSFVLIHKMNTRI